MMVIRQIKVVDGVIYWLCQLAGGAAVIYHYLFILPGKRGVEGMQPVG